MNLTPFLRETDAEIVARAGFWQGIRDKPVADEFYIRGDGPLPYGYPIDERTRDLTTPPQETPSAW